MSEFENERVVANARAMSVEDVKVFLTQIDRELLVGELDRRLKEAEKRYYALAELVNNYEKRND